MQMRRVLMLPLTLAVTLWPAYAWAAMDYVPPDMFGEPDEQESVAPAEIPKVAAPTPPPAPAIIKAPPPAPAPATPLVTKPLSDALRGVDNKAPPPPLPDLTDNVGKPKIIPKPDLKPMDMPETAKPETAKPESKPEPKTEPKTTPPPPVPAPPPVPEPAPAIPVPPVVREEQPPPEASPVPTPAPPLATESVTISAPAPEIKAPDIAPPPEDTSTSQDLVEQLVFAPGAADLVPNQQTILTQSIADALKQNPAKRLQIVAYASGVDTGESSARRISLNRALGIRDFLKNAGIAPERIDVRAMGDRTSASPVDRVDLLLIPAG